ncbi:MAG: Gfo/Idh/MocA family oxidoreductase, partial [Deferribacteres bacterium]|nr:Gfo/Idh/MocA family oxidoreductase [Deferribacteres bacterium]
MIRVAVIGAGSIGYHHARIFSGLQGVQLAGVVDINPQRARQVASEYNCAAYVDYMDIIDSVDAVSIAAPTTLHFQIGMDILKHGRCLLIEKPVTTTVEEADALIREAEKRDLVLQVGHLERFNPGVSMLSRMVDRPDFIECRRLSPFLGRGADVDVTLDLMIHDIDIILGLVNSGITDIRATGAKVLTENIDIARAWIEFENGCIAEATASRIEKEKTRRLRIFQRGSLMDLDYQTQEITCRRGLNG